MTEGEGATASAAYLEVPAADAAGGVAVLRRHSVFRLLAALAAGGALDLAFAPFGWWPLGIVAPALLFGLIRGLPPRHAAWTGGAFGVSFFAFGTYWLYTCLHVFGLVPVWLTLILQTLLVLGMAAYLAALCFLANRFWFEAGPTRDWLVLPVLWVLIEWLRGWAFSGFPWLSLGYAFIDSPLAGWAPLFGVYGVTAAAAYLAVAALACCRRGATVRQRALALGVIALGCAVPWLASRLSWTSDAGAAMPIAAVQGAVSQDQKWQAKNRDLTMTRYASLTAQAWGARLIVWPESAIPVLANELQDYLRELQTLGRAHDADFAIGLVNYRPQGNRFYNGLLVLSEAGGGWYYKRHLVPFGEYFPVPSFIRSWMRLLSLPYDDISPGSDHQPVLSAAGQQLGLTICYEDAFGSSQLAILREATLLINVTNNAWYGNSTAPHQHLQISRMRALEAGRYLIRSANDGITAVIDSHGRVTAQLPQFEQAVLRATVRPLRGLTPYARWGNYPLVLLGTGCLAWVAWCRRHGRSAPAPRPGLGTSRNVR